MTEHRVLRQDLVLAHLVGQYHYQGTTRRDRKARLRDGMVTIEIEFRSARVVLQKAGDSTA